MMHSRRWIYTASLVIAAVFFVAGKPASAASAPNDIRFFSTEGDRIGSWKLTGRLLKFGAVVTAGDITGDGEQEIIAAPGAGERPIVKIFSRDGLLQREFPVLDGKFRGGIRIDTGDLDGDGVKDIVISAQASGAPQVEAYTALGTRLLSFNAYAKNFRGGVTAMAGDINNDGQDEIVTISGFESPGHLRVFSHTGKPATLSVFPFGKQETFGATLALANIDASNPGEEIIVAPLGHGAPKVVVLSGTGKILHTFSAFSASVNRGLTLATANVDDDPEQEILAVPRDNTPRVRFFDADGSDAGNFLVFPASFRGGVSLTAAADNTIVAAPLPETAEGRTDLPRYIEIDLSDQTLKYYRLGHLIATERVSTGKWSMPTPIGTFKTYNKADTAYSGRYRLYMDNWMAITPDGLYGIHALPYWILKNGTRYYEGENHLGTPVSHGCIRLSPKAAKALFDWAPVGTTVIIHA